MTGPAELRQIKMLDLIYDFTPASAGEIPDMNDLFGDEIAEIDQGLWLGTLRSLDEKGLIRLHATMEFGGTAAQLLDDGRCDVEERRKRRQDPAARRVVASNGLLSWLYQKNLDGDGWAQVGLVLDSDYALIEGESLSQLAVHRAGEQLMAAGLIEGDDGVAELPGPSVARITHLGEECVESGKGVATFMRDRERENRPTSITTNFNAPIHGSNVSWASETVTQTVSTTGLVGDELLGIVGALRQALPVLGLTDQQSAEVERDVRVVEGELARTEPDKGVVRTMLMRSLDTIVGAGNSALGLVLMGLAKEKLKEMGIPIE